MSFHSDGISHHYDAGDLERPVVIYHPGLYGSKDGDMAEHVREAAKKNDLGYLAWDPLGHGKSDGDLRDFTVSKAIETATQLINHFVAATDRPLLLVGNSFGAGPLFHFATQNPDRPLQGFLGISAAPDSITRHVAPKFLGFLQQQGFSSIKDAFSNASTIEVPFPGREDKIPFTHELFNDAVLHTIHDSKLLIPCPSIFVHGSADELVSYDVIPEYSGKFSDFELKAIQNACHDLKTKDDGTITNAGYTAVTQSLESLAR